ncbi:hypothetical protein [Flavobacterium wongokense]|uniref:hypothetical protein n=1 Tax=Flavobacterium wongokense TaxID=2910674 RepID=UPI001F313347|nr:hypothetical protein [Flavobacterium sp. WG47]MCF6130906.1 hypothetical protein [Flavobacterium sp. WG47]
MKTFYTLTILFFSFTKLAAQDVIYFTGGTKIPGKITEILPDKVKFKNLANPNGPIYSRNTSSVQVAFNSTGDYLVFSQAKPSSDKEKEDFMNGGSKARNYDIIIDKNGAILPVSINDESEGELVANNNGKDVIFPKKDLVFLIRKNGNHQIFSGTDEALPYLSIDKPKINMILTQGSPKETASETPSAAPQRQAETEERKVEEVKPAVAHDDNDYVVPDMALYGSKALQKTNEFAGYLQTITSINTKREAATKSINMACGLFLTEDARVEVSNIRTDTKNKYKIRDYLNRLLIKSGQYDKLIIEYANISYASKFKKGPDGNYYGSVTFVQKFQGFVDGNLVYGDQTKRNMTVVLKHYEKAVNGENVSGWDVFLDDIGVVETKKL